MAEAMAMAPKATIEEKLDTATAFKDEGNAHYKAQEYKAAAGKYHRAILYMKGIDNDLHGTPAFLQVIAPPPPPPPPLPPPVPPGAGLELEILKD